VGLAYLGGCSLKDVDYLSRGEASGGADANTGGAASETGGKDNTGGKKATGGATSSSSAPAGGSTFSTTGPVDTTGCAFTATGGQLLKPPSNGFEVDLGGWTTTAQSSFSISRILGSGTNCEGNAYLTIDGSLRVQNWDGPCIDVKPYVQMGRKYQFTAAVRQSPSATAIPKQMQVTIAKKCSNPSTLEPTYEPVAVKTVSTNWTRITGQFTIELPGCNDFGTLQTYIQTQETQPPYASIDVDDFQLYDVTPAGSGTGGASGAGGASGTTGGTLGGTTGAGGTTASGGASSGGSKATGGTTGAGGSA
jgi:hypothetical protein